MLKKMKVKIEEWRKKWREGETAGCKERLNRQRRNTRKEREREKK